MAETVTRSLVHQFASMKPTEFGPTIEPKWQVGERLIKEVRAAVASPIEPRNSAGRIKKRLATGLDVVPGPSPDRRWVAYETSSSDLYIIRTDGSEKRHIASNVVDEQAVKLIGEWIKQLK